MKRQGHWLLVAAVALLGVAQVRTAWGACPLSGGSRRSGGSSTPTIFSVIVTRDASGEVTFEAVPCSEVPKREKAAVEEYAQALKAYREAKRDNPSEPAPKRPAVVVLERSVRGKDKALALAAQYREKYEAQEAKKKESQDSAKPTEEKAKDDAS